MIVAVHTGISSQLEWPLSWALFESTTSAMDSASGSVLLSEALSTYAKYTQYCSRNRGAKLV